MIGAVCHRGSAFLSALVSRSQPLRRPVSKALSTQASGRVVLKDKLREQHWFLLKRAPGDFVGTRLRTTKQMEAFQVVTYISHFDENRLSPQLPEEQQNKNLAIPLSVGFKLYSL